MKHERYPPTSVQPRAVDLCNGRDPGDTYARLPPPWPSPEYHSLLLCRLAPYPVGIRGHSGNRVPGNLGQKRLERREGFHDDGIADQVAHEEPAHRTAPRGHQAHTLDTSLRRRGGRWVLLEPTNGFPSILFLSKATVCERIRGSLYEEVRAGWRGGEGSAALLVFIVV